MVCWVTRCALTQSARSSSYLREVAHDAGVLFVQVVAFGFVGDELVQLYLCTSPYDVRLAQERFPKIQFHPLREHAGLALQGSPS